MVTTAASSETSAAVLVADSNANIYSQLTIESSADADTNSYDYATDYSTTSAVTSAKEENSGWNSSLYNTLQTQRQSVNTAWEASAEYATPFEKNANATPAATRAPCFILSVIAIALASISLGVAIYCVISINNLNSRDNTAPMTSASASAEYENLRVTLTGHNQTITSLKATL